MKKAVFYAILFLSSMSAFAQLTLTPTIGFCISKSEITYPVFSEPDDVNRLYAGVQLQKNISEKFRLGFGLQYAGKGFKARWPASFVEWRYKYIEVIPTIEYKPFHFVGIYAGAGVNVLIDADYKESEKWLEPTSNPVDNTEFGWVLGAKLFLKDFYLNFSYNRSLLSVSRYKLTDVNGKTTDANEFNYSFRFGIGYNFHLKKA